MVQPLVMADILSSHLVSCTVGVAIVDTAKMEAAVQQAVFGSAGKFCVITCTSSNYNPSSKEASQSLDACRA